jgi:hypothetical protein
MFRCGQLSASYARSSLLSSNGSMVGSRMKQAGASRPGLFSFIHNPRVVARRDPCLSPNVNNVCGKVVGTYPVLIHTGVFERPIPCSSPPRVRGNSLPVRPVLYRYSTSQHPYCCYVLLLNKTVEHPMTPLPFCEEKYQGKTLIVCIPSLRPIHLCAIVGLPRIQATALRENIGYSWLG